MSGLFCIALTLSHFCGYSDLECRLRNHGSVTYHHMVGNSPACHAYLASERCGESRNLALLFTNFIQRSLLIINIVATMIFKKIQYTIRIPGLDRTHVIIAIFSWQCPIKCNILQSLSPTCTCRCFLSACKRTPMTRNKTTQRRYGWLVAHLTTVQQSF